MPQPRTRLKPKCEIFWTLPGVVANNSDWNQSYMVRYLLYYNIWTGICLYDYAAGAFSAATWLINLDL